MTFQSIDVTLSWKIKVTIGIYLEEEYLILVSCVTMVRTHEVMVEYSLSTKSKERRNDGYCMKLLNVFVNWYTLPVDPMCWYDVRTFLGKCFAWFVLALINYFI